MYLSAAMAYSSLVIITPDVPITMRILDPSGNNVVAIGQSSHLIENTYEKIFREIDSSKWKKSGQYILHVMYAETPEMENLYKEIIINYVNEQSTNPNMPQLTQLESTLNNNVIIQTQYMDELESLRQENTALKLENSELKLEIERLQQQLIDMSHEFMTAITNLNNWFQNQLTN